MHLRRDETLDTLLALADKDGVGDDCRRQAQAFADGTLQEQLSTQNEYKGLAFFPGHPELDDAMRGVRLLNDNMNDFHASAQESLDARRRGQERIDYKNTHVITLPGASAYLRRAEAILRGTGAWEKPPMSTLVFALLLITGRLLTEILNVRLEFHKGSNGNEMNAIFGGQLKKRKKKNRVAFEIPLLVTFNLFRHGLDALRARQGTWDEAKAVFTPLDLTDKQMSERYRCCNMSRTLPRNFFEGATSTDCRRYYLKAVWIGYDFASVPVTFSQVAMRVLGHADCRGSASYKNFRLEGFDDCFDKFRLPISGWVTEPDKKSDKPEASAGASEPLPTSAPGPESAKIAVAVGNSVELTDCEFQAMSQRLTEREFQAVSQLRLIAGAKRPRGW